MTKLKKAYETVSDALKDSNAPVIWFSGGKDSMLVHYIVKQVDPTVPLLVYQDLWSDSHRDFVKGYVASHEVRAFMYLPRDVAIFPDGAIIAPQYDLGEKSLFVIMDVKEDPEICGVGKIEKVFASDMVIPGYMFDMSFSGSRAVDTHPASEDLDPRNLENGHIKISCPIWDWEDSDVWDAIRYLQVPYNKNEYRFGGERTGNDNGDFMACFRCYNSEVETVFCPKLQAEIPTNAQRPRQESAVPERETD